MQTIALQTQNGDLFRHEGNLSFLGLKAGDVFHVLWLECNDGDVYAH